MIEEVRVALLQVRQDRGLTYEDLASRIKRPSGDRYSADTVQRFLTDNRPHRDWRSFALDAVRGWSLGSFEFRRRPRRR
ncbi:MAG: hypothetical protein RBT81_12515 [Gammaproteobacteria bacterium]|jgi:hypothetical protein|nr:hypothetical protein [Gammaproteobacteria bacterium]